LKKLLTVLCVAALALAVSSRAFCAEPSPTASEIFDALAKRADSLKKYKLTFDYFKAHPESGKGKARTESRKCMYWYIAPDVMRLDVVDGDDKGSKVVYNGKVKKSHVRAKQGLIPAIWVGKDDPRLAGFFKSDWKSDVMEIKEEVGEVAPAMSGSEKIAGRDAWKIDFSGIKNPEFDKMTLWVDKKESVLLQYERRKGGAVVEKKTWSDIEIDVKLGPEDFKI
jgi:outer membrane lipoprotein-sorting protein